MQISFSVRTHNPFAAEGTTAGYSILVSFPQFVIPNLVGDRGGIASGGSETRLQCLERVGAAPNGCGSGPTEPVVPEDTMGVDVAEACGAHDICYTDPDKTKAQCELNF